MSTVSREVEKSREEELPHGIQKKYMHVYPQTEAESCPTASRRRVCISTPRQRQLPHGIQKKRYRLGNSARRRQTGTRTAEAYKGAAVNRQR